MSDSTHQSHAAEAVQDLLDERLAGAERASVQERVEQCPECRAEYESLRRTKGWLGAYAARQTVPPELRASIRRALDTEDRSRALTTAPVRRRLRWATGLGLAAVLASLSVSLWFARSPDRLPAAAVQDFIAFQAGHLALDLRTTQPRELEQMFETQHAGLPTAVYDLDMLGYRLRGGQAGRLQGRPSTAAVYDGPQARVLCRMYFGSLEELPVAAQTLTHKGVAFRVYRVGGFTAVFWPEGKVICVLVSDVEPNELIRLAFAKATPAPA